MLRALVLVLVLANLGFYAWTQGWLDNVVGIRARGDHEPERLQHQVRADAIRLITPGAAASAAAAAAAASAPPVLACLEAGPFNASQASAAEAALKSAQPPLPSDSWIDQKTDQPGSWIVYMGKYAGNDVLGKKEDELKRRNVSYEEVHLAGMEPGLSLGRFDQKAAADEALAAFTKQGIRTARVVQATVPTTIHSIRAERADPALVARLAGLQGEAFGKGFTACAKVAGN